jgi:hypothetical protein
LVAAPVPAQWLPRQEDVIAVEHLKSAMQYLEDCLSVFLIVWRGSDQLSADRERFDKSAAVEIHGQLRAFGVGI